MKPLPPYSLGNPHVAMQKQKLGVSLVCHVLDLGIFMSGDCSFVAFIDMEEAYDRVNRNKLFEVMRGYGMQEILVDVIERIYKSDSGVRQGCPLSPLLFNIYVR